MRSIWHGCWLAGLMAGPLWAQAETDTSPNLQAEELVAKARLISREMRDIYRENPPLDLTHEPNVPTKKKEPESSRFPPGHPHSDRKRIPRPSTTVRMNRYDIKQLDFANQQKVTRLGNQALELCDQALALEPDNLNALNAKQFIYLLMGDSKHNAELREAITKARAKLRVTKPIRPSAKLPPKKMMTTEEVLKDLDYDTRAAMHNRDYGRIDLLATRTGIPHYENEAIRTRAAEQLERVQRLQLGEEAESAEKLIQSLQEMREEIVALLKQQESLADGADDTQAQMELLKGKIRLQDLGKELGSTTRQLTKWTLLNPVISDLVADCYEKLDQSDAAGKEKREFSIRLDQHLKAVPPNTWQIRSLMRYHEEKGGLEAKEQFITQLEAMHPESEKLGLSITWIMLEADRQANAPQESPGTESGTPPEAPAEAPAP